MKKTNKTDSQNNLHYLKLLGIVFAGILFYAILNNLTTIFSAVKFISDIFIPIIIGLCMAFVLNLPLKFFENRLFGKLTRKNGKIWSKLKRPLCLTLSILVILLSIALILSFVIPQFIDTCVAFFLKLPEYMEYLEATIISLAEKFNLTINFDMNAIDWQAVSVWALDTFAGGSISNITQGATDFLFGLVNGFVNFILGFFFCIYILASKERMGKLAKSILYSVLKRRHARNVISVATLSNKAFAGFVAGQCMEVLLIGVLCFIGMLIFRMPYAIMVSCIIAITAFVPVFGPIIGAGISAFLIFIVDPIKALWFLVFIIVLQQLESNILYPKIMGKHVNLPGIWVLVAVTIGGGLFSLWGIIISIPICSVIYTLFNRWLLQRLEKRNICHATMSHDASEPNYIYMETPEVDLDAVKQDENTNNVENSGNSTDTDN